MKLIVLSDNRNREAAYVTEHGLSVYLETEGYKYLFDTGASGLFVENARFAGVDLSEVDVLFISHGHRDHIGGLAAFLEINTKARIVLSKFALNRKLYSLRNGLHEIGYRFDITSFADRFQFVKDKFIVNEEMQVFAVSATQYDMPKGNGTLHKDDGKGVVPDDFNHELVAAVGQDKLFVFTGCAHHGVLNMLETVSIQTRKQIDTVLGGFHLLDSKEMKQYETKEEIIKIGQEIKQHYPHTLFYTGHCTGDNAYKELKTVLSNQLLNFYAGMNG